MSDKSAVYIVKLFKEDGTNFFHASSTFLTSEGGEFRRLDLLFVDVEDNRGFQATFDETMLKKSKETTRSDDDFEELAKSAFATSSTEFRYLSKFQLLQMVQFETESLISQCSSLYVTFSLKKLESK